MNIYIDESGSINNHSESQKYFVIALLRVTDRKKLKRAYKRFVSSNLKRLKELDVERKNRKGKIVREGNKMFQNGRFIELKGSHFDRNMKKNFVNYFSDVSGFEIYYIKIINKGLTDGICKDVSTVFNYTLKKALEYFINHGYLPTEHCNLQLDERNEKTDKKHFLEQYLNTEFVGSGSEHSSFNVSYFDSSQNRLVQVADVFANLFYSHLITGQYSKEIDMLKNKKIIRFVFEFPLDSTPKSVD